ncbi:aminotransferase class I/II-fold pyridoxal phosphate-dependent enzyme [Streptomyces sp. NPDC001292]|uniref:aminotransferase class I/II-fold pyridoxal phosphate-dependent enzyme n=1 Tax=Streptomyces sp. NPDC001292 TaxID=3364558 RepID=UPI0036791AB2
MAGRDGDHGARPDPELLSALNREAFDRVGLRPGGTRQPGPPDPASKLFGRTWQAPLVLGPPAGPARPDDQAALVRAAAAAGLPAVVDATGLPAVVNSAVLPAELDTADGHAFTRPSTGSGGPLWLRSLPLRDRETARRLVGRAAEAGVDALLTPVPAGPAGWADLEWLRSATGLLLLVDGIGGTAEDAEHAVAAGADGIVFDSLPALPAIAAAVAGRCPVLLRGGVRRGADILVALALGADAVVTDHAGTREETAELVRELTEAMAFTGAGSTADIGPESIRTAPAPPAAPRRAAGRSARTTADLRTADVRKSDLHASVSDPVLDTMNFLNEITFRHPDAISFAPGRPYDGFFETEQIFTHMRRYLDHLAAQGSSSQDIRTAMYQYGPTAGRIREIIADSLRADENIDVPPESVVVTVGAQEAMLLVLRALMTGPEDVLLAASPCYVGITGAARLLDVPVTAVDEREDGLHVEDVEAAVLAELARGRRPRAFYVVPDHSNPSGASLGAQARTALLELAARHGFLVLEDSPYRRVSPGSPLPTLKSLDRARTVVHLGSFSKTVFPGARVGFAVADQRVLHDSGHEGLLADELVKIKSMVTVNTSSLSQAVVAGTLLAAEGRISELNAEPAAYYGDAMRTTLKYLDACLPADRRAALGVRWNEPTGGFFLKLQVPFRADNTALTRSAQDFGVIWTPMAYFHPSGGGHHAIRLSTSYLTLAEIQEGTARLARFIEAQSASAAS